MATDEHAYPTLPLAFVRRPPAQMRARARALYEQAQRRRSVRQFARDPVPRECIEYAIRTAGTAPSGAHKQPWTFVVVSDPDLKQRMRAAAEDEERRFYEQRAPQEWLDALAPLGTDWIKTHITDAPYVVVLFRHRYGMRSDGTTEKYYYTSESCGIAAGMFIAAVHHIGLATLPHTPSPMGFLADLLDRPVNEQAYLLMPVGYPAEGARVPDIHRKPLDTISAWLPQA